MAQKIEQKNRPTSEMPTRPWLNHGSPEEEVLGLGEPMPNKPNEHGFWHRCDWNTSIVVACGLMAGGLCLWLMLWALEVATDNGPPFAFEIVGARNEQAGLFDQHPDVFFLMVRTSEGTAEAADKEDIRELLEYLGPWLPSDRGTSLLLVVGDADLWGIATRQHPDFGGDIIRCEKVEREQNR